MKITTLSSFALFLASLYFGTENSETAWTGNMRKHDDVGRQVSLKDTLPPSIPLSNERYYPDWDVPSQLDGHIISGGRFDAFDLTNIVYHARIRRDSLGRIKRLGDSWIDFFDMGNQILGSFNVTANNPYKPENYENFLGEGYMDVSKSVVDRRAFPDYDWRKDVVYYATSGGAYENAQCGTLVVAYYLQALGADQTLLGVVATFVMLDHQGKEIARLEDLKDVFFGEGIVTCDRQYFCFRYGGAFTEEEERMYNDHFRIYDITSGEIIYDWELPKEYSFISAPFECPGGWLRINMALEFGEAARLGQNQQQTKTAVDLKNRIMYKAPADPRLNFVQGFTEDGFIIQDPKTGALERIRYKDWSSEKF
jgi:hypothetical protein